MRKILTVLLLLPFLGFAQEGKPIKSIAIPRTDTPLPNEKPEDKVDAPQYSIAKPFEPKLFKVPPKVYEEPKLEPKGMANQPKSDLNVGKQYADKMNKSKVIVKEGAGDSKEFRRHQYFGEYKTESETIGLSYRDFGEVDGDWVRVWIDGKLVAELIELDGVTKKIYLGLVEGINHIEIEALNEGVYFPNTGEFEFFDQDKKLITADKWGLSRGFKARFTIHRVPKGTLSKSN